VYSDNTQGKKARFKGKRFDEQIAQVDTNQNKTFGTTSRRREIGKQVETQMETRTKIAAQVVPLHCRRRVHDDARLFLYRKRPHSRPMGMRQAGV
jgi:hypothetical protein